MKKLLLLGLLFVFILSCEDTKKTSTKKEETPSKTTSEIPIISEVKINSTKQNYPKITQENAVQFLTDYGIENPETKVRITTTYGSIDLKLFTDTPLHRANFIYLVKRGYFNETFFHRVVPSFIIQGGSSDLKSTSKKRFDIGQNYRLPYEKGNGRKHTYGTVSGAKHYRKNPDNLSVPFEFFIFLGPKTSTAHLNGNYTVFGKVTKGMEIVEVISKVASDGGEWPIQNIYLTVEILD